MVVERTDRLGGTSAYSGGACWLPGSAVQRRAGIPDSTASARAYLDAVLEKPDAARLAAFLAHAPELVDALEAAGFAFEWLPFPEYFDAPGRVPTGRSIQPVAIARDELPPEVAALVRPPVERDRAGREGRRTLTGGQALVARLLAMFVRDGGAVRTGHRVTGLLTEGDQVTGVVAETAGGTVELRARRGVLLAAGGFEGSASLRQARASRAARRGRWRRPARTPARPIEAALAVGAAADNLAEAWFCPGLEQPDGARLVHARLPRRRHGRHAPAAGTPTSACRTTASAARWRSRRSGCRRGWCSTRARAARCRRSRCPRGTPRRTWPRAPGCGPARSPSWRPPWASTPRPSPPRSSASTPTRPRARTPTSAAAPTSTTRSSPAAAGRRRCSHPIAEPPFHAARFVLSDLGTKGGLVTDAAGRVLREDGSAIGGLYAAGNTAASLTGAVYPGPGVPLGTAMVFASLAVRHLTQTPAEGH